MMVKGGMLEERPKFEGQGYLQGRRTDSNPLQIEGGTVGHCQRIAKLRAQEWRRINWKKMR